MLVKATKCVGLCILSIDRFFIAVRERSPERMEVEYDMFALADMLIE